MKKIPFLLGNMVVLLSLGIYTEVQAAPVARLTNLQGEVLVSAGEKFRDAQSGMVLNRRDTVLTLEGASAQAVYPDNCIVQIDSNTRFVVGASDQCSKTARKLGLAYGQPVPAEATGAAYAQKGAIVPPSVSQPPSPQEAPVVGAEASTWVGPLAVGLVTAGAVTAIILASNNGGGGGGGGPPISPE